MIELNRHIEILLLNNDCVIIPQFGGFMAHYVESGKDKQDDVFLPPMRTIGFNPKLTLNDSLLAQSYVEVYDISYPDALSRIADEVRELKQHLENDEKYELNHIGILRLNADGEYEFEPSIAGILTPSLYGLSYFDFKTLEQIEAEQLAKTLALPPPAEAKTVEMVSQDAGQTDDSDELDIQAGQSSITKVWRNIAAACLAVIVFLLTPSPLANKDTKIIQGSVNTQLLNYILPKDATTDEKQVESALVKTELPKAPAAATPAPKAEPTEAKKGFTIVFASKITHRNAQNYVADLKRRGYAGAEVVEQKKLAKVVFGNYPTQDEAYQELRKLNKNEEFKDAWVMKY